MLADVVLVRNLSRSFTYRVPPHLQQILQVGSHVLIPLGRTTVQGMVIEVGTTTTASFRRQPIAAIYLKDIVELIPSCGEPSLDLSLITVAKHISDYYIAPLGLCLRLVGPSQAVARVPVTRRLRLTEKGKAFREMSRLAPPLIEILSRLEHAAKGLTVTTLKRQIKAVEQYLPQLSRRGLIQEERSIKTRDKVDSATIPRIHHETVEAREPSTEQQPLTELRASAESLPLLHELKQALEKKQHREILYYASDQLSCSFLLSAVHTTYEAQRTSMLITDDIEHATSLAEWANRYWPNQVEVIHRGLSESIHRQRTLRVAAGTARILIGTRSAVFAQVPNLGLIAIVHEESASLKDDQCPYYHAREVARIRAKSHSTVLLLTTASPTVETFHAFSHSAHSNAREPALCFPHIDLIDLKETAFGSVLSQPLVTGIQQAVAHGGQAVIFLNRKGFSRALSCHACGATPQCLQCHIPLTMYKTPPQLACAYCHHTQPLPLTCPSCFMPQLHPVGVGVERVEELVRLQFPHVPQARLDSDATPTASQAHALCNQFRQGRIKILIGTQLLFQGMSLPPVRFVGIPNGDTGLHVPDFRAAERGFHQLSKAIALAEPENKGGHVVLQTYLPTHHVMRALADKNPLYFYEQELALREPLAYPPFSNLMVL